MSKDTFDASTTGFRIYPNTDSNGGFIWLPRDAVAPIMFDTATDEMAAAQWNAAAQGAGTHAEFVQFIVETAVCPGIILATTQNAAVAGGPYGSQPPGIWLSPDFGSGPAIFQLSDDIQDEQVIQQWYCWTVGSATVNVTVSESWAVDQPPPVPEKFVGILPKLSPSAMDALNDLLARTADVPEDETATD
jgi:hypothetical protein